MTYVQILQAIDNFAANHYFIRSFRTGVWPMVEQNLGANNNYPLLYMVPQTMTMQRNTIRLNTRFLVIDIVRPDEANLNDVWSDTNQTLTDLALYLRDQTDVFNLNGDPSFTAVFDRTSEKLAGWEMNIVIELTYPNGCNIPFSEIPEFIDHEFPIPLTCDTLASCSTFQDVIERLDEIENIINNGTPNSVAYFDSNGELTSDPSLISFNGSTFSTIDLYPLQDNTYNLGSPLYRWRNLWVTNINGATFSGDNTGDVTLSPVGNNPNVNAASLNGQILNLEPASSLFPGVVTTYSQSFSGVKTFEELFSNTHNPNITNTYDLGTPSLRWRNIYSVFADVLNLQAGTVTSNNIISNSIVSNTSSFDQSTINELISNSASITNLITIDLESNNITTNNIYATSGYIKNFKSDLIIATSAIINAATINSLGVNQGSFNYLSSATISTNYIAGSYGYFDNLNVGGFTISGNNSGDVRLTPVGNQPNIYGATLSGQTLTLQIASNLFPGLMSTQSQTFSGIKQFNNDLYSTNHYPILDNTYDLGSNSLRWRNVFANNGTFNTLSVGTITSTVSITNVELTNSLILGTFTPGSILFIGSNREITENNPQLFFNNTTSRVGIGVTGPSILSKLHILATASRGLISNSTYTAVANNDYANNFTGTFSTRNIGGDTFNGILINPLLQSSATSSQNFNLVNITLDSTSNATQSVSNTYAALRVRNIFSPGSTVGGGSKYGIVVEQSGNFSFNAGTNIVGIYVPAYSGTTGTVNYGMITQDTLGVITTPQNMTNVSTGLSLLRIAGSASSNVLGNNIISMLVNSNTLGDLVGITIGTSNLANLTGALHWVGAGATRRTNLVFKLSEDGNLLTRMTLFGQDGNFSIGTTNNLSRLTVVSSGSSASSWTSQFHNSTGSSNTLMLRDDGFVGIGTASRISNETVNVQGALTAYTGLRTNLISNPDNASSVSISGNPSLTLANGNGNTGFFNFNSAVYNVVIASGEINKFNFTGNILIPSGILGTLNGIKLNGTFDTGTSTGLANGGAFVNAISMSGSFGTWSAFKTSNNIGYSLHSSGTAPLHNFGSVLIGTENNISKLHILATASRGLISNSTYTAVANNDYANNFTGTFSSRSNTLDNSFGTLFNPRLIANGTTQSLYGVYINPTFATNSSTRTYALGVNGDLYVSPTQSGVVMNSPDGTRWRIQINNAGALTSTII